MDMCPTNIIVTRLITETLNNSYYLHVCTLSLKISNKRY